MTPTLPCLKAAHPHFATPKREADKARTNESYAARGTEKQRLKGRIPAWYLGDVDPTLLEGAGGGVVGAQVAVLAPVAAEGAVDTRQAPAGRAGVSTGLSTSAGLHSPPGIARIPGFPRKIIPLGVWF